MAWYLLAKRDGNFVSALRGILYNEIMQGSKPGGNFVSHGTDLVVRNVHFIGRRRPDVHACQINNVNVENKAL